MTIIKYTYEVYMRKLSEKFSGPTSKPGNNVKVDIGKSFGARPSVTGGS